MSKGIRYCMLMCAGIVILFALNLIVGSVKIPIAATVQFLFPFLSSDGAMSLQASHPSWHFIRCGFGHAVDGGKRNNSSLFDEWFYGYSAVCIHWSHGNNSAALFLFINGQKQCDASHHRNYDRLSV